MHAEKELLCERSSRPLVLCMCSTSRTPNRKWSNFRWSRKSSCIAIPIFVRFWDLVVYQSMWVPLETMIINDYLIYDDQRDHNQFWPYSICNRIYHFHEPKFHLLSINLLFGLQRSSRYWRSLLYKAIPLLVAVSVCTTFSLALKPCHTCVILWCHKAIVVLH